MSHAGGAGNGSALYPVFLRLAGRRVLLVGAGPVAASKLQGLLDAGAHVTVVAPDVVPEIERAANAADALFAIPPHTPAPSPPGTSGGEGVSTPQFGGETADREAAPAQPAITLHRRAFELSDLDDVWYVVAAATPEVNRTVSRAADARHLFVNAVDDPPNATAYLGGVLRRGGVTVAISTDGQAPALAGLLREGLDALLPQELVEWMDEARAIRREWLAAGIPMEERRPLLLRALNGIYAKRARTETEVPA